VVEGDRNKVGQIVANLALSRDMARAMGGELTIASTPGVGTQARFWLTLPSSQLSSTGAPPAALA
jgi:hypothetical protein